MAKIDWDRLEIEYITTKTSYSKLAKKHSIALSSVEKYASKNNWQRKRRQYYGEVKAKTLARASAQDVDKLEKLKEAADKLTLTVEELFKDDKQFRRHIIDTTDNAGNFTQKEKLMKKYDSKALRDVTAAVKDLTATIRNLHEIYTVPELQDMDIKDQKMDVAVEKLQIVKDKIYGTEEEQEELGVIEIAAVMEGVEDE